MDQMLNIDDFLAEMTPERLRKMSASTAKSSTSKASLFNYGEDDGGTYPVDNFPENKDLLEEFGSVLEAYQSTEDTSVQKSIPELLRASNPVTENIPRRIGKRIGPLFDDEIVLSRGEMFRELYIAKRRKLAKNKDLLRMLQEPFDIDVRAIWDRALGIEEEARKSSSDSFNGKNPFIKDDFYGENVTFADYSDGLAPAISMPWSSSTPLDGRKDALPEQAPSVPTPPNPSVSSTTNISSTRDSLYFQKYLEANFKGDLVFQDAFKSRSIASKAFYNLLEICNNSKFIVQQQSPFGEIRISFKH